MKIFTGSYANCKSGNLVSISGDKGKSANFTGHTYTTLAPKREFFKKWKNNTTLTEDENNTFYMKEFYLQVLSQLDPKQVLNDLLAFGNNVIILCYEGNNDFCHRHLVAAWLERNLQIEVPEIAIDEAGQIRTLSRNSKYIQQFLNIIDMFESAET